LVRAEAVSAGQAERSAYLRRIRRLNDADAAAAGARAAADSLAAAQAEADSLATAIASRRELSASRPPRTVRVVAPASPLQPRRPVPQRPQRDPAGAAAAAAEVDTRSRLLDEHELIAAKALFSMGAEKLPAPPRAVAQARASLHTEGAVGIRSRFASLSRMVTVPTLAPRTQPEVDRADLATKLTAAYNKICRNPTLTARQKSEAVRDRFAPVGYRPVHPDDMGWGMVGPKLPAFLGDKQNLARGDDPRGIGMGIRAYNTLVGGGLTDEQISKPVISLHWFLTACAMVHQDTIDHVLSARPPTHQRLMENYEQQSYGDWACWVAASYRTTAYVRAHADAMGHKFNSQPLPWGPQPGGETPTTIPVPDTPEATEQWHRNMMAATFDAAREASRLMKVRVVAREQAEAASAAARTPVPTAAAAPGDKRTLDGESSDEEMIPVTIIESSDEEPDTPSREPKRPRPATPHPGRGQPLNEDTEGVQESLLNAAVNDAQESPSVLAADSQEEL